jgi:RNA polymerase sigma-70 factor, ECF subfamily
MTIERRQGHPDPSDRTMTAPPPGDRMALFERLRPRLFGIAYRMLGSIEDGEDLVQESFLRWQQADPAAIREPEGWLVAVVTRLSIDRLRRARTEREAYVGHWLPEPMATPEWERSDTRAELASDLSMAFLVLLERLAPEERAALLLRDVFDSGYDEIGRVLEKSETACRQMVHRARARVRRAQPRFTVSPEVTGQLLERFLSALQADDKDGVMALLAEDVAWTTDGGGKVSAVRNIVRGALSVTRMALGFERKSRGIVTHRVAWLNGEPTWMRDMNGRVFATTSIVTDGTRILALYCVLNPDKLRHVGSAPAASDDPTR